MNNTETNLSWEEINTSDCNEASLQDMCSWGEVN